VTAGAAIRVARTRVVISVFMVHLHLRSRIGFRGLMHRRESRLAIRLLERTMALPMLRCSHPGDRRGLEDSGELQWSEVPVR
jgi:hypothetical protein